VRIVADEMNQFFVKKLEIPNRSKIKMVYKADYSFKATFDEPFGFPLTTTRDLWDEIALLQK